MLKRSAGIVLLFLTAFMLVLVVGCGNDDDSTGPDIPTLPVLTTSSVTSITQTTAQSGGNITSDGGATVTARGVCWSTSPNPTVSDSKTTDGSGTGSFTSSITGLTANTQYYVRAYATNSAGTGYGSAVPFTTSPADQAPTVSTTSISNITQTTAQSGGTVSSDGGATVTARGVCWSTSSTPTIANSKTTNGSGTGSFTSSITGLTPGTQYYVRAYATNSAGTGYGSAVPFTTSPADQPPTVSTTSISNITQTTAQSGGTVSSDGGATVTTRGVCWSTSSTPTIADSKTINDSGMGSFASSITGLTAHMTYYVRAYATNSVGTSYGSPVSFMPGTVTDIDGNVYKTVMIGGQEWMMENLKVMQYRNGEAIPNVTHAGTWSGLTSGAYCEYDNDIGNVATYGRLYNWSAVVGSRTIAPAGWHVPTDEEWKQLEMYLGMSQAEADDIGWRGADEGGKLKETGTTHWASPNTDATNQSGFSALPGGYRLSDGNFADEGHNAIFWTSTGIYSSAWYRSLDYNYSTVFRNYNTQLFGLSVRCVKD